MRRRYRWLRQVLWLSRFDAAFIAVLNEFSNLPPHKVGFMHLVWDIGETIND